MQIYYGAQVATTCRMTYPHIGSCREGNSKHRSNCGMHTVASEDIAQKSSQELSVFVMVWLFIHRYAVFDRAGSARRGWWCSTQHIDNCSRVGQVVM